MVELVVEKLPEDLGPGDIVGAFTNEVKIDGGKIGRISFKRGKALVEVSDDVARKVIQIMDGNQVAGIRVDVYPKRPEILLSAEEREYIENFRKLVEMEREEELSVHLKEIKNLTGKQREEKGRAILHLQGRDAGECIGGQQLIKFVHEKQGEELPETEIQLGDTVILSKNYPQESGNPTGTVVEKSRFSITVAFEYASSFLYKRGLRLDLFVNDTYFKRMLKVLENMSRAEGRLKELREILVGKREPEFSSLPVIEYQQKGLNSSQKEAVRKALAIRDIFLVHGPPGTGKTVTCTEVILQALDREKQVLATADSPAAVDNLMERLIKRGLRVVRIGRPVRVSSVLREHTLDYLLRDHHLFRRANKLRQKAFRLKKKQGRFTNSEAKRCQELFVEIKKLEEGAVEDILSRSDVICTTNCGAGSKILEGKVFDLVVIDQANRASEPETLVPLSKAKKLVLAGDHLQLPPTVLNPKARKRGLGRSLFERFIELHGDRISSLLKEQYRMNEIIMEFPSREFYEGQLIASSDVANLKLKDLNIKLPDGNSPSEQALKKSPLAFLDTKNLNAPERLCSESCTFENLMEADLVVECLEVAMRTGISGEQVAVISPYKDQVNLIRKMIKWPGLEVATVDGYSGREKDVVIISCVRSNPVGSIGFLRDLRRLNVSLTRARRSLIIIGDSNTIAKYPVYLRLIEFIKSKGFYYIL